MTFLAIVGAVVLTLALVGLTVWWVYWLLVDDDELSYTYRLSSFNNDGSRKASRNKWAVFIVIALLAVIGLWFGWWLLIGYPFIGAHIAVSIV